MRDVDQMPGYSADKNQVLTRLRRMFLWAALASAGQAVVITRPHAVADTFHTDWANEAQDKLGLPVLHLYAGSGFIGDS